MPNKMPAFGLSAVPLPRKNRKMLPGCHAPTAAAAGELTAAAAGPTSESSGSPLEMVAAALAVPEPEPSSRRVTASAAQASGAAAGDPPPLPDANHDTREGPIELTKPRGAAAITGTSTAAPAGTAAIDSTTAAGFGTGAPSFFGAMVSVPDTEGTTDAGEASAPLEPPEVTPEGLDATSEEVVSGTTAFPAAPGFLRRGAGMAAELLTGTWARARGPSPPVGVASFDPDPDPAGPASAESRVPARGPRAGVVLRAGVPESAELDESAALAPVEPPEPVVSAKAIGNEARPEPTPRATANAPTRPT